MTGRLSGRDVSLDVPLGDDGGASGLDLLADENAGTEERCADAERSELVRKRVERAMKDLTPRERYIVEHRLLSDDEETLAEIGRHLGLSRERVRQIEERLKSKLQTQLADLVDETEAVPMRAAA
jgi:RNA polymerase sigma-32 factor